MEEITQDKKGNKIYHFKALNEIQINSNITFKGSNNILYFDKNAKLENTNINFNGDNSLVFIGNSVLNRVGIYVCSNNVCYIGNRNYFNPTAAKSLSLSERKNIIIGDDCLFSYNIWFRIADPHLIYDSLTYQRINPSKSIFLGDHVWIGQDSAFVKGAFVCSGSIIGAKSLVGGKIYYSNTINAGNPCKEIKRNIFWTNECVHNWDLKTTLAHNVKKTEAFKFSFNAKEFLDPKIIDERLDKLPLASQKLEYIYKTIHTNQSKNRFALNYVFNACEISGQSSEFYSAKERITRQLAYRLGKICIENSKSFKGCIKLPFKLLSETHSYHKEKELYKTLIKINPSFSLPKLESYPDYKEALKFKEHLSYKLGLVLIETKMGGGIFKLPFKIYHLIKEFKNSQKNKIIKFK